MGKSLNVLGDRTWFIAIAYIAFSLYLIFTVFRTRHLKQCCQTAKWYSFTNRPIVLGLLTGINFCPSFLLAFTKAINLSGPLSGMALFGAFFVGTSLFLLPLAFFGVFGQQAFFKRVAQVSAIGVGAWFIAQGVWALHGLVGQKSQTAFNEKNIINVMDSLPSYIITDDTVHQIILRQVLAASRKGSVTLVPSGSVVPDRGYFFAYSAKDNTAHAQKSPLRKAGRFIVLLPSCLHDSINENKSRRIAAFLTKYSFKIDPDSGSVFSIPASVVN